MLTKPRSQYITQGRCIGYEATGARAEHPLVTRRISARQQAGGVSNNIRK